MSILTATVRASKALTVSVGVPTDADTVTIGGQVYRFESTIAQINDVFSGATIGAAGDNLAAAINAGTGAGTKYYTGTVANAYVTAVSDGAGVVTVTARTPGAVGNFITISEAGTHTAWAGGATVLSGGSGSSGVAIAQTATELAALLTRNQANSEIISEVNALYAELVATGAS